MASLEHLLLVVIVLCAGFVAVTYAAFPLLLCCFARAAGKKNMREGSRCRDDELPAIQVVVPCYNEADRITDRIADIFELDYPPHRISVLVIDDGSTDGTGATAESSAEKDDRVRLLRLDENRGKAEAINTARQGGDLSDGLICFTDADVRFSPGALRAAVRRMSAPKVGLVAGSTVYSLGHTDTHRAEGFYWRLENAIRRAEGELGLLVSASGALILIRGHLLKDLPADGNTDFSMPLSVLAQGYACAFAPEALVQTRFPERGADVFSRRKRTILRALSTIGSYRRRLRLLARTVLFWHKTARFWLVVPAGLLLGATALGAAYARSHVWFVLLTVQILFYLAAAAGAIASARGCTGVGLAGMPYQFVRQHLLAFAAVVKFARGLRIARWRPLGKEDIRP